MVDTEACAERGVWVSNSPDYGVGEVSTHALAMALVLIRHLPFYVATSAREPGISNRLEGTRCSDMTLGIVRFGRIESGWPTCRATLFRRVIACIRTLSMVISPRTASASALMKLFAAERRRQAAHAAQRGDARDGRRQGAGC